MRGMSTEATTPGGAGKICIRRALISVWDKTGVVEFARALHDEFGIEIISTGGTAKALTDAGIPVTLVETLTGCGEMLGGRVKTLHPAIHAAILADRDNPEHMRQLEAAGIKPIDMVVVNLYPFEKTVADPDCTFEQAIEMIDIGGVALLRAAAKNHRHVLVVSSAEGLSAALEALRKDSISSPDIRIGSSSSVFLENGLGAFDAFWSTSAYDDAIAGWLSTRFESGFRPAFRTITGTKVDELRYGENSHQIGEALQRVRERGFDLTVADSEWSGAQPVMSYNNYLDADAALGLCAELTRAMRTAKLRFAPPGAPAAPPYEGGTEHRTAKLRFAPIRSEQMSRRNLPHWQIPGATYWIEYSSRIGELSPAERSIAMDALRFWDGKRLDLHTAVVMPDHVHALLTPREVAGRPGEFENLSALLKSVKGFSGREISKLRGGVGMAWVHESYDHWIRSADEFRQKWDYTAQNVVKEGLARTPGEYAWWYGIDYFGYGIGAPVTAATPIPPVLATGGNAGCGDAGTAGQVERNKAELRSTPRAVPSKAELRSTPSATQNNAELRSPVSLTESKAELCTPEGDVDLTAVVFIKHTNACGVGVHAEPIEAYRRAYLGDPNAAMGGILAVNFAVDAAFAAAVMETYDRFGKPLKEAGAAYAPGGFFVEVWIAPRFTDDAVAIIRGTYEAAKATPEEGELRVETPPKKKWGENVRLVAVGDMNQPLDPNELQYRSIAGGLLVQSPDLPGLNEADWKVVTKRPPTPEELADLRLAWLICKHTKSNAISLVKDGRLIGNGAGQMSRVMSCRVATWMARENGHIREQETGLVAASDAFFPFSDGPKLLIDAGVTAIIQPGGSKRDQDTIDLCNERGVAMIFTATRHFRH